MTSAILIALSLTLGASGLEDRFYKFPAGSVWNFTRTSDGKTSKVTFTALKVEDGNLHIERKEEQDSGAAAITSYVYTLTGNQVLWLRTTPTGDKEVRFTYRLGSKKGDSWKNSTVPSQASEITHMGTGEVKIGGATYQDVIRLRLRENKWRKDEFKDWYFAPQEGLIKIDHMLGDQLKAGIDLTQFKRGPTPQPHIPSLADEKSTAPYDVVIRGGRIVDGTGNPWYLGDVGVRNGRIAAVGRLRDVAAKHVIDAAGRIVAPGFVDVHTHMEPNVERRPTADNLVADGVTTVVTGNCGLSRTDLAAFFVSLRNSGISLNLASLIGHNEVRKAVLGIDLREPSAEEQTRMDTLVDQAMRDGAVGLSTGLIYTPGTYAKTPEIVALARVVARHGGIYASHIRNEDEGIFAAIDEALAIGREAALPVEISHFKLTNKRWWGKSDQIISRVETARAAGLDVTVDQYPYTASSTSLSVLLPSWAMAGGTDALKTRLADQNQRKKITAEMTETIGKRGAHRRLDYAVVASCAANRSLERKSIATIARERKRPPGLAGDIETVLELMDSDRPSMIYHSMDERDVERILRYPYTMVGSDGGVREMGDGVPHPRSYGTNARVLARYVRDRKVIRLEEAIRKMTSLPAQRFGLVDRGILRPGLWADLVVFDEKTVVDRATFDKPHAYTEGFHHVLVNGVQVWRDGQHTGSKPGRVLLGPGLSAKPATAAGISRSATNP